MKDAIHHLKRVQKKIIQSVRKIKSVNPEASLPLSPSVNLIKTKTKSSKIKKKTAKDKQLGKSFSKMQFH